MSARIKDYENSYSTARHNANKLNKMSRTGVFSPETEASDTGIAKYKSDIKVNQIKTNNTEHNRDDSESVSPGLKKNLQKSTNYKKNVTFSKDKSPTETAKEKRKQLFETINEEENKNSLWTYSNINTKQSLNSKVDLNSDQSQCKMDPKPELSPRSYYRYFNYIFPKRIEKTFPNVFNKIYEDAKEKYYKKDNEDKLKNRFKRRKVSLFFI